VSIVEALLKVDNILSREHFTFLIWHRVILSLLQYTPMAAAFAAEYVDRRSLSALQSR
jgi:hypothetical protein